MLPRNASMAASLTLVATPFNVAVVIDMVLPLDVGLDFCGSICP
jgi:hypothetical protein